MTDLSFLDEFSVIEIAEVRGEENDVGHQDAGQVIKNLKKSYNIINFIVVILYKQGLSWDLIIF